MTKTKLVPIAVMLGGVVVAWYGFKMYKAA
jgi:hypothetical protein